MRGRLQELGVLRASGHEHFTGSLVVPVTDPGGHRHRALRPQDPRSSLRTGTPDHLYLPGPHRGVWNEEGLAGGEVILCESLIDALSSTAPASTTSPPSYGTSGFTADHTDAFERQRVSRVLIAYDHDAAGDTAAAKVAARAHGERHRVLPGGLPLRPRRQRRGDRSRPAGPRAWARWCAKPSGWARGPAPAQISAAPVGRR